MKNSLLITTTLWVAVLLLPAVASAQPYGGGPKGQGKGGQGLGGGGPMAGAACDLSGGSMAGLLPGLGGGGILKKAHGLIKELGLTTEQKAAIKQLRQDTRDKVLPLRDKLRQARKELKALLKAKSFNPAGVEGKYAELKKIRDQIADLHFKLSLDIYALLSAEQKDKLWSLIESKGIWPDDATP